MGKISLRPVRAKPIFQSIIEYLNKIQPMGNQKKALDYIEYSGEAVKQMPVHLRSRFQDAYTIIGPPGTGKTWVICTGVLKFLARLDKMQRGNKRFSQVAIGTFTNSASDRVIDQFNQIFDSINLPSNDRYWMVRQIVAKSRMSIDENVSSYFVPTFKPKTMDSNEWKDKRDEVDAIRIFVGTIYQIQNALTNNKIYKLKKIQPNLLIIDEASQLNLSKLNLAFYRTPRKIQGLGLVGDPNQLPPISTIQELQINAISHLSTGSGIRGLPPRINKVIQLNYQRRMRPIIRKLSEIFGEYKVGINDHPSTQIRSLGHFNPPKGISSKLKQLLDEKNHIVILDNSQHPLSKETQIGTSWINLIEASATNLIAEIIRKSYPKLKPKDIISIMPYVAQQHVIEDINCRKGTVDTFQGQEAMVVIASTTRTDSESPLDFVANRQRMNVLVSRAQAKLVILTNRNAFEKSKNQLFMKFFRFLDSKPNNSTIIEYDSDLEQELKQLRGS